MPSVPQLMPNGFPASQMVTERPPSTGIRFNSPPDQYAMERLSGEKTGLVAGVSAPAIGLASGSDIDRRNKRWLAAYTTWLPSGEMATMSLPKFVNFWSSGRVMANRVAVSADGGCDDWIQRVTPAV